MIGSCSVTLRDGTLVAVSREERSADSVREAERVVSIAASIWSEYESAGSTSMASAGPVEQLVMRGEVRPPASASLLVSICSWNDPRWYVVV